MLLVGSTCLQRLRGDIGRQPADVDIIGTNDELSELIKSIRKITGTQTPAGQRVPKVYVEPLSATKTVILVGARPIEFEIVWPGFAAAELEKICYDAQQSKIYHYPFYGHAILQASLDVLYTLKMSHRYLKNSPHFLKTMRDIQMMRGCGAKIFDQAWLKRREEETYTYKHPKLNVMKGDFFKGDGIDYVYDHDDIHKSVAHLHDWTLQHSFSKNAVPAYTLYMKDGAEVLCSKEKFFAAHEQVRLYGVLEEAYVLALERSQIPYRDKVTPRRSFEIAMMKVCTSITSGWFREYAWENYDHVMNLYRDDYVDRFWTAVNSGKVRQVKQQTNEEK